MNYLVERGSFRAQPRMTNAILAVVKHFAVKFFVSIVAVFLFHTAKLSLLQKKLKFVWFHFFLLFGYFRLDFLLWLGWAAAFFFNSIYLFNAKI